MQDQASELAFHFEMGLPLGKALKQLISTVAGRGERLSWPEVLAQRSESVTRQSISCVEAGRASRSGPDFPRQCRFDGCNDVAFSCRICGASETCNRYLVLPVPPVIAPGK